MHTYFIEPLGNSAPDDFGRWVLYRIVKTCVVKPRNYRIMDNFVQLAELYHDAILIELFTNFNLKRIAMTVQLSTSSFMPRQLVRGLKCIPPEDADAVRGHDSRIRLGRASRDSSTDRRSSMHARTRGSYWTAVPTAGSCDVGMS